MKPMVGRLHEGFILGFESLEEQMSKKGWGRLT